MSAPAEKVGRSSSCSQYQPPATGSVNNATKTGDLQDEPSTPDAPEPPVHTTTDLTLILLALCLAVFLAAIDSVIITPAMPTIAKELNASDGGFAWIGPSYLLAIEAEEAKR